MGWLFAVALGLQEQKRVAVFRALPPMVLGHALSIAIIIAAVLLARVSLPYRALKIAAAVVLFAFGFYRVLRSRHPNWVGMRVGFGDLTLWSFVMASAHGAGLMLVPFFLGSPVCARSASSWESPRHGIREFFCAISARGFGRSSCPGISSHDGARRDFGL